MRPYTVTSAALRARRLGGKVSAKLRQAAAVARDRTWLVAAGPGTPGERVARLNAAGYRTAHGKPFTRATVSRMLRRARLMSQ